MKCLLTCPHCKKIGIVDVWYAKDVDLDHSFLRTFSTAELVALRSFNCSACKGTVWACAYISKNACKECYARIDCLTHENVSQVDQVPIETLFTRTL